MTCNSRGLPEPERMENMADDPAKVLPIMNDHEWQISHLVHAQIEIAHGDMINRSHPAVRSRA